MPIKQINKDLGDKANFVWKRTSKILATNEIIRDICQSFHLVKLSSFYNTIIYMYMYFGLDKTGLLVHPFLS